MPNYDNQLQQPSVLPAGYPNLLVNGTTGIAVGMATNMAPHNLVEVVTAAVHLLEHPEATVEELMRFVPAPDLPSGGTIVGLDGIKDAYTTGRGSFKTRARVAIEPITPRKTGITVTELPYMVGPEKLIEKIKDGVQSKKLSGISDVTDLTDRKNGLKLVIGIKTGFSPEAVLEQLYRYTPLEDGFSINNVALVDGQPRTLGLKELLRVYLDHRLQVVTRRSEYRLARRKERLHLVEGLLVAILDIDEVIQVIRTSDDAETARTRLEDVFDLSRLQSEYILELRLRRLTKFSRIELEAERDQLLAEIAQLEALLASPVLLRRSVSDELESMAERFGTPRRTLLTEARPQPAGSRRAAAAVSLEIADAPCRVLLSTTGRLLRVDLGDEPGIPAPARRSKHDAIRSEIAGTTRGELGAVTDRGRLIRFSPVDLPAAPVHSVQLAAGVKVGEYLTLEKNEKVLAIVDFLSEVPIAIGTAQGVVKRVAPGAWPNRPDFEVIGLKAGDRVIGANQAAETDELVFVTTDAQLLHFAAGSVRPQGAAAGGMAGVKLGGSASAIFFGSVDPSAAPVVVTVSASDGALPGTDPGRAKVSDFTEFPGKGRATGGVRSHAFLRGEAGLALAWVGTEARAVGGDGSQRILPVGGSRRDASGTPLQGVVHSIGTALGATAPTAGGLSPEDAEQQEPPLG